MRLLMVIFSLFVATAPASPQSNSFEESFKTFGKKLDQAKAKGEKLGADAKKEWKELKQKTEKVADSAAEKTQAKSKDWSERIKGAASEIGTGIKNAWAKLVGEP